MALKDADLLNPQYGSTSDGLPYVGSADWYTGQTAGRQPLPKYSMGAPTQWQGYGAGVGRDVYGQQPWSKVDYGAHEEAALDALQQLATGQKSYALEEAERRSAAAQAGIGSQALSAQRGMYNPALARQAQRSQSQAGQQIGTLGKLAAERERQAASQALMGAGSSALSRRQALQRIQAGYAGMGLDERYRQAQAREQKLGLDIRKGAAARAADHADTQEKRKIIEGTGKAAMGALMTMAGGGG
jgi:hypothetical protein